MSEIRKPYLTFLLRYDGKKKSTKLELFDAFLWNKSFGVFRGKRYRMRVNGKWFQTPDGKKFFYKYEIRDIFWRSLKI